MKFAIVTVLGLAATSAHAENWVKTYANEIAVEYVDTDSIKRNGANATASFKRDYTDHVKRFSQDAAGDMFSFVQSRSVMTFDCSGDKRSIDQLVEVSADGKTQSAVKSYAMSQNNGTWDAAAKEAVCK
jgi:hypothetical protein